MQRLRRLISAKGPLAQLNRQLAEQKRLTAEIRKELPAPLDAQLQGAVMSGRTLSLLVHSPVWASRLRYLAPRLLRQLKQRGLDIEQIHPRIVPEQLPRRHPGAPRAPRLSPHSAEALRQTAETLEPGPLQEALRRLSRHQE